jgi:hypothetical protein
VPTLVLVGQFDPVAGPALGRDVAERIGPAARWIDFADVGHNVRHFSACGARIAFDFINNPEEALDTACASRKLAIFATKGPAPFTQPGSRTARVLHDREGWVSPGPLLAGVLREWKVDTPRDLAEKLNGSFGAVGIGKVSG